MTALSLNLAQSEILIHTVAKGFLSPLAHDLRIRCSQIDGSNDDGSDSKGSISIPVAGLKVVGVMKKGRLDTGVLSDKHIGEIEQKIRTEVLDGGDSVKVSASLDGNKLNFTVTAPKGGSQSTSASVTVERNDGGATVSGKTKVSMKKLGLREVKGPLGAFKVADDVEIEFKAVFNAG